MELYNHRHIYVCVPCEPTIQRNLFHRQAEPSLLQVCFINLLWPFELVSQMLSQQRPHVQWLIHEHEADIAWIIVDPWNASNASLQPPTYCARRHVIKRSTLTVWQPRSWPIYKEKRMAAYHAVNWISHSLTHGYVYVYMQMYIDILYYIVNQRFVSSLPGFNQLIECEGSQDR